MASKCDLNRDRPMSTAEYIKRNLKWASHNVSMPQANQTSEFSFVTIIVTQDIVLQFSIPLWTWKYGNPPQHELTSSIPSFNVVEMEAYYKLSPIYMYSQGKKRKIRPFIHVISFTKKRPKIFCLFERDIERKRTSPVRRFLLLTLLDISAILMSEHYPLIIPH